MVGGIGWRVGVGMRSQCKKCPWRKDVDPYEIPDGYSRNLHCGLAGASHQRNPVLQVRNSAHNLAVVDNLQGLETLCWLLLWQLRKKIPVVRKTDVDANPRKGNDNERAKNSGD